jgi:hypothetical protein
MTTTITLLYRILKNPNHNILLDNGIRVHSPEINKVIFIFHAKVQMPLRKPEELFDK